MRPTVNVVCPFQTRKTFLVLGYFVPRNTSLLFQSFRVSTRSVQHWKDRKDTCLLHVLVKTYVLIALNVSFTFLSVLVFLCCVELWEAPD